MLSIVARSAEGDDVSWHKFSTTNAGNVVIQVELFNHSAFETVVFKQCKEALLRDLFDHMNPKGLKELALLLSSQ